MTILGTLLGSVLATGSLTRRHQDLLARAGITPEAQLQARLTSTEALQEHCPALAGLPPGILLPIPAADGTIATVRLFPEDDPLAAPPIDLGQLDPALAPGMDLSHEGLVVPAPFVAPGSGPRAGAVVVVPHALWALALAGKTGRTVVSTCGECLLESGIRLAARLTECDCLTLAPYVGPSLSLPAVRRATAIAGLYCRDIRIATWTGKDIASPSGCAESSAIPAVSGRLWGARSLKAPALATLVRAEGLGTLAGELTGNLIASLVERLAERAASGSGASEPDPTATPRLLAGAGEVHDLAAGLGARSVLFGGVAIDLVTGRQVRTRKDLDLAVAGGPDDSLERVVEALRQRGFTLTHRRSQSQAVLSREGVVVDLYRLIETPGGYAHLATRFSLVRFPAAGAFMEVAAAGSTLSVMSPPLLYFMKRYKATAVENLFLRSFWRQSLDDRADLAALGTLVEPGDVARRMASGEFQRIRILPFALRPLPRFRSPRVAQG